MEIRWKSWVCFVRFCVVLILALLSIDVESSLKEQEPVLAYLLESGTINQEMAELLQGDCSPEFLNSKQTIQDIELQFTEQTLRDNAEFSNSVSYGLKMYDAVDLLRPQINNILVDCMRRKKLMLDSGEDESLNTWYARYFWVPFNWSRSSTRRVLAQTPGEAPAPSPSALSPGPAPSLPLAPSNPPSSPPPQFLPKNSNVQPTGGEQNSVADSNGQSNGHKTSKRTVVTAVVVTASVTLLIAALLFLCWRKCGHHFKRGRNDERPLLSLSMNDYSIASAFGHGAMGTEEKISNEYVNNKLNQNKIHGNSYMESQSLSSSKAELPPPSKVEDSSQMPPGLWSAPGLPPLKPPPGRMGALKPPPGRTYPSKPPPRRTDPPKPLPDVVNSSALPPCPPSLAPGLSSFPYTNPFLDSPHAPPPPPPRAGPPPPQPPPPPRAGPPPPQPPPPPKAGHHPPPPPLPPRAGPPPPQPPPPRAGPPPPQPPSFGVKPPRPAPPGIRPTSTSTSDEESEAGTSKAKLKPFFWDKVLANPDHSMVWHQIKSGSFQFNEEMIETLFGYAPPAKTKTETKKESSPQDAQPQYIQLIDHKKSQNIAILLKALNVTTEEVCDALVEGNELPPELVQTLLKMAPTSDEELKLRLYAGELSQLGPAERFLKVLVDIPFAFKRLDSLLFMCTLQEEMSMLKESFAVLDAACTELRKSRLFLKLLEAVLKTGNRMNDGTFRGGAQAFKLDTLLKLSDVKGTDGKTTLLHFVVQEITRSEGKRAARMDKESGNLPEDLDPDSDEQLRRIGLRVVSGLGDELENVKKAAILDADSITGMVSKLRQELKKVRDFLNSDMKNLGKEDRFHQTLRNFVQNAEVDVTWAVEEEKRIMALVKNTADYFHGNSGKDEGLRLFTIVRDFLIILDKVCKEVKSNPIKPKRREGATVSATSPDLRPTTAAATPPVDLRERLFPAIAGRRIDSSSSDDES